MRRVLYVDAAPFAGGAQQSLCTLIAALDTSRYEAWAAGPPLLRPFVQEGRWAPIEIPSPTVRGLQGPAAYALRSIPAAAALFLATRRTRSSLLHANGRGAWLPSWIAARSAGIPLAWHARDLVGPIALDRIAAALSDLCFAPSEAMQHQLIRAPGCLARHIRRRTHVVPNGIDTARFTRLDQAAARMGFGLPLDRVLVGMIGQWAPWKRVDLFLDAAIDAFRQDPALHFVLAGAPPPGGNPQLRTQYRAALSGIGTVLDWTAEMPALLSALDLLLHPTADEAFGRVIAEAMSCSLPVIAVRGGGAQEMVQEGITGLLVPPDSAPALSAAVLQLASDPERRRVMGRAGRSRIVDHFGAALHAARIQVRYDALLRTA